MTSRIYPDRPFLAASVAVVRNGRVLLIARAGPPLAGLFSLPGGVVEAGETLAEAAVRELAEETGIRAGTLRFLAPVEVIERDGAGRTRAHFVIGAHAARWVSGEVVPSEEVREARWVSLEEAGGLPTTAGLLPILAAALDGRRPARAGPTLSARRPIGR